MIEWHWDDRLSRLRVRQPVGLAAARARTSPTSGRAARYNRGYARVHNLPRKSLKLAGLRHAWRITTYRPALPGGIHGATAQGVQSTRATRPRCRTRTPTRNESAPSEPIRTVPSTAPFAPSAECPTPVSPSCSGLCRDSDVAGGLRGRGADYAKATSMAYQSPPPEPVALDQ